MSNSCYLCDSVHLESLPAPGGAGSVTTDGRLVKAPWRKLQCHGCGLVQSADRSPAFSYAEDYRFYDRPHMRAFDVMRYSRYAAWVSRHMRSDKPLRVLEVGCGAGWVLEGLRAHHPQNSYWGLEPAESACAQARAAGLHVKQGSLLGEGLPSSMTDEGFDFIYSINVIEHVENPIAFVRAASELLAEGGALCVICPDGGVVDSELLFSDHLFSFPPAALNALFAQAGVRAVTASRGEAELSVFQAICGGRASFSMPNIAEPPQGLLLARTAFMRAWQELDGVLCVRLAGARRVLCFGAGEMSDALRAYAPGAWAAVGAYVIDRPSSALESPVSMHGLPVYYLDQVDTESWDAMLLGTKPHYQPTLFNRLQAIGLPVVRWDDSVLHHA